MIEPMAQVHMSEAEVANNFAAALEKVRQGLEVVVEDNHQSVAVLRPAMPPPRKISEVLARMSKNSEATMDADFARDVEAAIESHREPLDPQSWD
jgi:antitoxin (DNA-binding transcriptional repressor) of toxin-antitoxin stability system